MDSFRQRNQSATVAPSKSGWKGALCALLAACLTLPFSGCGGGSSSSAVNGSGISGNWQFTLSPPDGTPPPFSGDPSGATANSILQGGFLIQQNGTVTGQAVFSVWVTSQFGSLTECNSGTATITGSVSGQSVSLTAVVGTLGSDGITPTTQTFTLSGGQLSSDNSTIQGGTYSTTAGYYLPQGSSAATACGTVQSGLNWSAASVPSLSGGFQGFFHSTTQDNPLLAGQIFGVSATLTQGQNTGSSSATVSGSLVFTGYPCLSKAGVSGQISGSSVVLQIFNASSGANAGQIGGLDNGSGTTYPVIFNSTPNGYVLQNPPGGGIAYALNTSGCPGSGLGVNSSGDAGNVCLGLGNSNTQPDTSPCSEPITLSPSSLTFAAQALVSGSRTRQLITLTNVQPAGSAPLNIGIRILESDGDQTYPDGGGDFNGFPNFTEQDTCGTSLDPQQSCTITISFTPEESCPWLPSGSMPVGLAPAKCPGMFNLLVPPKSLLSALLNVTIPRTSTPDGDSSFVIPLKGTGLSAIVPSTPELDFGAEDAGESSEAQTLTFTNQSPNPVQILSAVSGFGQTCNSDMTFQYTLSRPPQNGVVPGLVVVATNGGTNTITPNTSPLGGGPPTVMYYCDFDLATNQASFQISSDTCSGQTLGAAGSSNNSCAFEITFSPQPDSYLNFPNANTQGGLDYFLELNTLECDLNNSPPQPPPGAANPCELDSGRFPVELTANPQSSLRMAPAAGLNFGTWLRGAISTPLTVTLTNDQQDNQTVNFTGKALTGVDYLETDNCPATLAPGSSCVLTFTLTPTVAGIDNGSLTLGYNTSGSSGNQYNLRQYIYLRGIGQ